jgi:arylsulfatase A-like enzyme
MLTGKYPITTGLRENSHSLDPAHATLFEILQGAGFQTGVFVANFELGSPGDAWIYRGAEVAADGFQGRRRQETRNESAHQALWDERVERAALDFLEGLDPARPFAAMVHFYDLHKPYNPPADYQGLYPVAAAVPELLRSAGPDSGRALERHLAEITFGRREVSQDELAAIFALYDATVTATDARLGRLLEKLDERGLRDATYLVFTADHGEELFDRNRYFYHGASIYPGTVRIPLVVNGPGLPANRRVRIPVQNLDIAPTVLELLGVAAPGDMEGRSLVGLLRGSSREPPRPHSFVEWQDLIYSVSDGRRLYLHNPHHIHPRKPPYYFQDPTQLAGAPGGFAIDCFEAYDLEADPAQQRNLLADRDPGTLVAAEGLPAEFAPLRRALDRWLEEPQHERSMHLGVSAEQLERLQALGYTGVSPERKDVFYAEPCAP